jgi:hypothetical protein
MKHSLLFFALLMLAQSASAQSGSGSHGGNVLDVNGTTRLYDLATKAKCSWVRGEAIYRRAPALDSILKKVGHLHWYLEVSLRREISRMEFCFTGQLYRLAPSEEPNSPILQDVNDEKMRQAGIRKGYEVYLDEDAFDGLSTPEKGYFIVHETFHTYLPNQLEDRRRHLYEMVTAVQDINRGKVTSSPDFQYIMEKARIDFPRDIRALDPYRRQLSYLLASDQRRQAQILGSSQLDSLLDLPVNEVNSSLWSGDVLSTAPHVLLAQDFRMIFLDGTLEQVSRLLKKQSSIVDPLWVGLANYEQLSPDKKSRVLSPATQQRIRTSIATLQNGLDLNYHDYRIWAPSAVQELAGSRVSADEVPFTSLSPRGPFAAQNTDLPPRIKALAVYAGILYREGHTALFKGLYSENAQFYDSLSLKGFANRLARWTRPSDRERNLALRRLRLIREGLVEEWFDAATQGWLPQTKAGFRAQFDNKRFSE